MRRLANNENGGLLTFGVAAALWSSSAALVSIVGALNRAYDIEEGRPWWKVRLVAIGLTLGVAVIVLVALSLVLGGPALADRLGQTTGWGAPFEWTWLVLQWPLVFALVTTGIGLIFYFGPDADQDWVWISPGAVAATILWLLVSLLFKLYIANFTDYEALYGTVGGVIVVLLWFYLSGIAILAGAELNAEIEHASPHGKAPGQKSAHGKLLIGQRAARAFRERQRSIESLSSLPSPGLQAHTRRRGRTTTTSPVALRTLRSEHRATRKADLVRIAMNAIVAVGWTRLAWKSTRTLSTSCSRSRRNWRRIGTRHASGPATEMRMTFDERRKAMATSNLERFDRGPTSASIAVRHVPLVLAVVVIGAMTSGCGKRSGPYSRRESG